MFGTEVMTRVRDHENPASVAARFRRRRFARFLALFPELTTMHVIDVGGRVGTWVDQECSPRHITITNVSEHEVLSGWHGELPANVSVAAWDATTPPSSLLAGQGKAGVFDLVYSNSVIEHVGSPAARARFAHNVQALAPAYWIQTPNRYFPLEPHWMFPGFQFLPVAARAVISRHWPFGYIRSAAKPASTARNDVLAVDLLGRREMESLFPHAALLEERVCGLTKSFVAASKPEH